MQSFEFYNNRQIIDIFRENLLSSCVWLIPIGYYDTGNY